MRYINGLDRKYTLSSELCYSWSLIWLESFSLEIW